MSIMGYIVIFAIASSIASVLLASMVLLLPSKVRISILPNLISYASGTLLGAALLGMLPKAIHLSQNPEGVLISVLFGIVLFFAMEKMILWRHCHKEDCEVHNAAAPLIIIGDGFHNLIDGVVIASSFLISVQAGIVVSIAVIAHELPQEVGDFAILLHQGYSKKKALLFNLLSSSTTLVGGVVSYFALAQMQSFIPYILSISAASFLYIALADILPGLQKHCSKRSSALQFILLLLGISTIVLIKANGH